MPYHLQWSSYATGPGAYALGRGSTAIASKGGMSIAIGAGAYAKAIGGVAIDIGRTEAVGMSVGAVVGYLTSVILKYV